MHTIQYCKKTFAHSILQKKYTAISVEMLSTKLLHSEQCMPTQFRNSNSTLGSGHCIARETQMQQQCNICEQSSHSQHYPKHCPEGAVHSSSCQNSNVVLVM